MKVIALALNTFREAIRNKMLYAAVCFAVFTVAASFVFGSVSIGDQTKVVKDFGLFSLSFFGAVISVAAGVNLLNKELQQKTEIKYGDNPTAGKYADIRGFKMYYEIYGTGKPLLIIHGNGGSIKDFSKQVPYFSKEYKVILADSRAQGKSADAGEVLNYEMMADDFNALLDMLHLDSCYVIGWSDGGINGLLLAMRHPEKVKKLAVTGANLWPDTTAVEPGLFHWLANMADSLSKVKQTPEIKNQYKSIYYLQNYIPLGFQQELFLLRSFDRR